MALRWGGGGEKRNSSTKNTKSSLLVPSLYNQASNPESLSETMTRSGSAAKKRVAEVLTS